MTRAFDLLQAQLARGVTKKTMAAEIGYSRTAVSLYLANKYPADRHPIEAAILKRYDLRICPVDGAEKPPEHCRRIALRPRPHGFPDAETQWLACQTCPHKPNAPEVKS